MKISLITISYNNEHDIEATILSVVNQTYRNIEYLIIDGGSQDGTLDIAHKYLNKIHKIVSEKDNGIYDAINKGIKAATGDLIGLIHAGDELYDETVIEKIAFFFQSNNIDALYGHSKIYSAAGNKVVRVNKSPEYRTSLFSLGWFPSHQSFYAKRDLYKKYGYYNSNYRIAADYELLLRFFLVYNIRVQLLDDYLIKFKMGGTSTKSIGNIIEQNKECAQAWKDQGLSLPFYTIPLKLLRKANQIFAATIS